MKGSALDKNAKTWDTFGMNKRTYGTGKVAELKIKIEPEVKNWLVDKSKELGITIAEYIRRLVKEARK